MPAIKAEGIYKVFGRGAEKGVTRLKKGETREHLREDGMTAAVIDASFEVNEGEIFVVMGLSGSGKSTLIRTVNGLLEPTAGSMSVYGQDITKLSRKGLRDVRRDKISMVFQHFALFPHRTVGENAAYGLQIRGLNKTDRVEKANEALRMVGLDKWADSLPGQLSGGMRQRVGLARALAAGTDILLMDEAFSALDPLIRREMRDQLIDLQQQLGKTILFITHDLNEAMQLGDRIAMMRDGAIVQIGTAEQILNDPANDYVAAFVQDVDRTRVLTADSVMEPPAVVLGADQGPRVAHKLMREHQLSRLFVVSKDKVLRGLVREDDIAAAVRDGKNDLKGLIRTDVTTVASGTAVADLFGQSAEAAGSLPVLDDGDRLIGVIPRVTLLNALSSSAADGNGSTNGSTNGATNGSTNAALLVKSSPDHPPAAGATPASTAELEV